MDPNAGMRTGENITPELVPHRHERLTALMLESRIAIMIAGLEKDQAKILSYLAIAACEDGRGHQMLEGESSSLLTVTVSALATMLRAYPESEGREDAMNACIEELKRLVNE